MRDVLFKLRVLTWLLRSTFAEWRENVWHKELDQHYCCDGRECGCGGMSRREFWNH